jgi:hypothetical protein
MEDAQRASKPEDIAVDFSEAVPMNQWVARPKKQTTVAWAPAHDHDQTSNEEFGFGGRGAPGPVDTDNEPNLEALEAKQAVAFEKSTELLTKFFEIAFLIIALYFLLEFSLPVIVCEASRFGSCIESSKDLPRLEMELLTSDCNSVFQGCQENDFVNGAYFALKKNPNQPYTVQFGSGGIVLEKPSLRSMWAAYNTTADVSEILMDRIVSISTYLNFCECLGQSTICTSVWKGILLLMWGTISLGALHFKQSRKCMEKHDWMVRVVAVASFYIYCGCMVSFDGCPQAAAREKRIYVAMPLAAVCCLGSLVLLMHNFSVSCHTESWGDAIAKTWRQIGDSVDNGIRFIRYFFGRCCPCCKLKQDDSKTDTVTCETCRKEKDSEKKNDMYSENKLFG